MPSLPANFSADLLKYAPAGREPCGAGQTFSFSPGSPIDFTVILREAATAYHRACFDTFNMKS